MMYDMFMGLHTQPLSAPAELESILTDLCRVKELAPTKYGSHEPFRLTFDPSKIKEVTAELVAWPEFYWRCAKRINGGVVRTRFGQGQPSGEVSVWVHSENSEIMYRLRDILINTSQILPVHYGYVHALCDQDFRKGMMTYTTTRNLTNGRTLKITRPSLMRCVPDLYWVNLFGPEYVAAFGRQRFQDLPIGQAEEVSKDSFLIQLGPRFEAFFEGYDAIESSRHEIKRQAGCCDFFFDYTEGTKKSYRVPKLGWEGSCTWPIPFIS